MKDNRTDNEKERSEHFSHWEYSGSPIQRYLKLGPKKAIYRTISEAQAKVLAEQTSILDMPPVSVVVDGAKKAIGFEPWWMEWNEQQSKGENIIRQSPWAFQCVKIRANSMATVPWGIFIGDEEQESHPLKELLLTVNPTINWEQLISATVADQDIFGFAYWQKIGGNPPKFIKRINPKMIKAEADDQQGITGFKSTKSDKKYSREQIIFFHGYDPDNDIGSIAPIDVAKRAIEIEIEADKHLKQFFGNRAMPDYIMSMATTNDKELKRVSDVWSKEFGGSQNQHKTGFVGGGAVPHEMGYAPDKLALEQVRAEARREICGAFGVTPALVGAWEAANYATIKEQRMSLYTEHLIPQGDVMASIVNAELAILYGPDVNFRWKWDELPALQETVDDKAKRYSWLVQAEIIKPETAAVDLGFQLSDVPKPKPANPNPFNPNGNIGAMNPIPTAQNQGAPTSGSAQFQAEAAQQKKAFSALAKWKRKVLKRLEEGSLEKGLEFETDAISNELQDEIRGELAKASNEAAVKSIFDAAATKIEQAPEEDTKQDYTKYNLLLEAIKALRPIEIKAEYMTVEQREPDA
jgi:HK97 family phage portal protein